jgi:hypothetical protein
VGVGEEVVARKRRKSVPAVERHVRNDTPEQ